MVLSPMQFGSSLRALAQAERSIEPEHHLKQRPVSQVAMLIVGDRNPVTAVQSSELAEPSVLNF